MPFSLTKEPISASYDAIRSSARGLKSNAENIRNLIAAGAVPSSMVLGLLADARSVVGLIAETTSDPATVEGLVIYARAQASDDTMDVLGSVRAATAAIGALIGAIVAEYPRMDGGYLADRIMSDAGGVEIVNIPGSRLTGTAAAINVWLATVS